MHELSFELGIPAHELAARLPERHFRRYQAHAARWMLPTRRLQFQLAKIAMLLDRQAGHPEGTEFRLGDYLFDPPDDEPDDAEALAQAARDAVGFKPINKAKKEIT